MGCYRYIAVRCRVRQKTVVADEELDDEGLSNFREAFV